MAARLLPAGPAEPASATAPSSPPLPPPTVSVHDVMPETLDDCRELLALLRAAGWPPATLLVVPGRAWRPAEVAQLRAWSAQGHPLAAHGWTHRLGHVRGLRSRLHAALISRDAGEHLALSRGQALSLMRRAAQWFATQGLPPPALYVPPAWALGPLRRGDLRRLPYRQVETAAGLLDCASGRSQALPLLGFEADTAWRAALLRRWNHAQLALARRSGASLRIALHPHDLSLALGGELRAMLAAGPQALHGAAAA